MAEETHVSVPVIAIRAYEQQLERTQSESEFWYSFARELVTALVQRRGTLAARRYVMHASDCARRDFPADAVSSAAVTLLLDEPRRLSLLYSAWGSFRARDEGLARGEERDEGG